jgi:beta-N-acetylglucosaminidase-like protein
MRSLRVCSLVLVLTSIAAGQGAPVWTVVSARELDGRIQRQIGRLASDHHATLRYFRSPQQGHDGDGGQIVFHFDVSRDAASFAEKLKEEASHSTVVPTSKLAEEGYILRAAFTPRSELADVSIEASSAAGFHKALLRVPEILTAQIGSLPANFTPQPQSIRVSSDGTEVVIADYPSFPIRGIVEGFYGPPWSHDDRLDMLRFLGQHAMNIYIYGPKDDPYHRKLWREDYPPTEMKLLGELAAAARENFVDFTFAISPGLSMTYSSEADFQILTKKLESVSKLGISNFALFLDDVPQDLVHPEDQARFRSLAQAHIYLINRLYEHLKSQSSKNRLTVCPTTYTNEWGNRNYIRMLGAAVNPEISLHWTGTEVISKEITVTQAEEWGNYLQRKPLVWDNFPTNDPNPWWLNLGPMQGREAGLASVTQGLFSNPMYQVHLTMIPLETVADYLWNPMAYNPTISQTHALMDLYGPNAPQILSPLLQVFTRPKDEGSWFGSIFSETWAVIDIPAIETQIAQLNLMAASLRDQARFAKLVTELEPIQTMLSDQLAAIRTDGAFNHLPDGKIQWNREHDLLKATRVISKPVLDGDFAKWESETVYILNRKSQIEDGESLWSGPAQFSARVALAWDEHNLYVGVDVIDPQPYQPFQGRGIENGDAVRIIVDTTLPIAPSRDRTAEVFDLYLSPGDFTGVPASVFCNEDFFPLRAHPHNYQQEIPSIWKKTATGFSGDIVLPARFFDRDDFSAVSEIGLSFGVQRVFPSQHPFEEASPRITFTSKSYRFFSVDSQRPATFQRLVLERPVQ